MVFVEPEQNRPLNTELNRPDRLLESPVIVPENVPPDPDPFTVSVLPSTIPVKLAVCPRQETIPAG